MRGWKKVGRRTAVAFRKGVEERVDKTAHSAYMLCVLARHEN